ncbi:prolipoprotein diacylglyceryl transferase [Ferruginibacter yonginensis]|uniref:Prolipoprotein diacylglyceryl transferase n=1 Tax=Ferruginibacter yonginensis TaxID=1310416 RepID=A0ABV8QMW8_9BACT
MYPNLYYVFKDWFGVEWNGLKILNTFGLMVALSFVAAALVINAELKRKEKQGLLLPSEETIVVGKPASLLELFYNALVGFIFGAKLLGLLFFKPADISTQEYIFSKSGSVVGGLLMAILLVGLKYFEKNKQKLKTPEARKVRIWPHDRVGDIVIISLIFGILGAKLFDNFEHWDEFMADPIGKLFSVSGLTFYGGLIMAAAAVCWYAHKKRISLTHLVDAAAPSLMIAYAIGRIGCQVAGDGDWGIYNSAYISDRSGNVSIAGAGEFEKALQKDSTYFLEGKIIDRNGKEAYVTDRTSKTLSEVAHKSFKGPSFLPTWLFAYSYPQNVNNDGVVMPGVTDDHYSVLPQPVFPTPLYETIFCTFLFLVLWAIRKKIKIPLMMFGIYLVFNGMERFFVELIRVNKTYTIFGLQSTQAEVIAVMLMLAGLVTMLIAKWRYKA